MNRKTWRRLNYLTGWLGAALLVAGYLLNSFGVVDAGSLTYQLLNLVGALCLLDFSIAWKAYPNAITNGIWLVGAIVAICLIIVK